MPSRVISPAHLSNPLATIEQLSSSSSSSALDRVPSALETSVRYAGARLTQAAGVLVRLPQDVIARAIVLFTRFWLGPEGGSLRQFDADVSNCFHRCPCPSPPSLLGGKIELRQARRNGLGRELVSTGGGG